MSWLTGFCLFARCVDVQRKMEREKETSEEKEEEEDKEKKLHRHNVAASSVDYQEIPIMHWEDLSQRIAELEKQEQERRERSKVSALYLMM